MPVRTVARMIGEHDTRLWRVLHHSVDEARARADASGVTQVAIDETAARRGHDYITLFVDIDQARVPRARRTRTISVPPQPANRQLSIPEIPLRAAGR